VAGEIGCKDLDDFDGGCEDRPEKGRSVLKLNDKMHMNVRL
tara:strand:- start:715 stop:837 length:123 start_codon:yes stop_codon:yes gene_type:complete